MTTIHAVKRKTAHITKKGHNLDYDFNIKDSKNQIELCKHRSHIKKGVRVIPRHMELIHMVLPKSIN